MDLKETERASELCVLTLTDQGWNSKSEFNQALPLTDTLLFCSLLGIRNLIAFSEDGSDPYVRMYLLPDKRRSGRRKTHVSKKTLNPVFDQRYGSCVQVFVRVS